MILPWLLDTFFPRRCVSCQKEGSWICHECRRLPAGWPREVAPGIIALTAFAEGTIREAIHGLKYHSLHELAEDCVAMVWPDQSLAELLGCTQATLVPVPTSFARRKKRGFNQAELIAQAFACRLNWPVRTDLLVKTAQGTQVGKGKAERQAAGYALKKNAIIPSGPLVLVDDLCTTGSTIKVCRQVLGREVPALVLTYDELTVSEK